MYVTVGLQLVTSANASKLDLTLTTMVCLKMGSLEAQFFSHHFPKKKLMRKTPMLKQTQIS